MRAAFLLLLALALFGCSHDAPAPDDAAKPQASPEAALEQRNLLYGQLHSGLFQADSAVKKIADATDVAQEMKAKATGDLAKDLAVMIAALDGAGAILAEETGGEPPTEEQVKKDEAKYGARRTHLIEVISDTLHDLRDQEAIAGALSDTGTGQIKQRATRLDELFNQAIEDLVGALTALGGKEEESQMEPDTGDTNQRPPPGYSGTTTG